MNEYYSKIFKNSDGNYFISHYIDSELANLPEHAQELKKLSFKYLKSYNIPTYRVMLLYSSFNIWIKV